MTDTTTTSPAHKRTRRMAREPEASTMTPTGNEAPSPTPVEKAITKTAMLLELLRRPAGATLEDIVSATGWLPHTTRAALTGLKKKGHSLSSEKINGVRRYHVAGAAV